MREMNQIQRPKRAFTDQERRVIRLLAAGGMTPYAIAPIVDRNRTVVRRVVLDLDGNDKPRRHGGQHDAAPTGLESGRGAEEGNQRVSASSI